MSNKTILQENNTKLSTNNTSLGTILQTINNLPDKDVVQSKSVTITQNGVTTVTPDTNYDTMNEVTITTNVGGVPSPSQYVQDGLIALFDESSPFDSNEHWNNLVGDDYIYVYSRNTGNSTNAKMFGTPKGFCTHVYTMSTDYYKNGNTIEIVAILGNVNSNSANQGCWAIVGNIGGTAGIGIRTVKDTTSGYLGFINWDTTPSVSDVVDYFKPFGASVYFENIIERTAITQKKITVSGSLNGQPWTSYTTINNVTNASNRNTNMLCLSYYDNQYKSFGQIKCIRIYNRKLTDNELATNHAIDKARFNLED